MNLLDFDKSPVLNFFKRKPKVEVVEPEKLSTTAFSVPYSEDELRVIDAVKILTVGWDSKDQGDLSGEYKRHQVYSKLIKIYPTFNKKRLGLFIELVLNKCV